MSDSSTDAALHNHFPFPVHPSLESVPASERVVYPDDIFPNGNYVSLPYGRVRFWTFGPESGTRVVLIHGLSIPAITYKDIAPYLAERGFRILIYDLYGKGYSEAPQTKYTPQLFVTQLALLLQYVRWEHAHIVGFSMGGGIATAFAASLPHLVTGKIVLIAAAGLTAEPVSQSNSSNIVAIPQYAAVRDLQIAHLPGYKAGVISCVQDGPIRGLATAYNRLSSLRVGPRQSMLDVLVIHGTDDQIVPYGYAAEIKKRVPQAKVVTIEGGEHSIVAADGHWQKVAENIVSFLTE